MFLLRTGYHFFFLSYLVSSSIKLDLAKLYDNTDIPYWLGNIVRMNADDPAKIIGI